ncbi:MAG: hypothetical protein LAO51_18290 [Acidobacteriia bacterium]|nr:hypothetical protein [Terriglobia bacterium]
MRRVVVCFTFVLAAVGLVEPAVFVRELTFDERVSAQEAIERVCYSHQIGATKPFDEAVPRAVLERKVRDVLRKTVALETYWKTPVTATMLDREVERMLRSSRLPSRLQELFAALHDDPFLIKECVARATLVDRMTRSFYTNDAAGSEPKRSWDEWWASVAGTLPVEKVHAVADDTVIAPAVPASSSSSAKFAADGSPCVAGDAWERGTLDGLPSTRLEHTAVWTGSEMIVWGGVAPESAGIGSRYDPATDSWTRISGLGAPTARSRHTAVWTGHVMVIWGGYEPSDYLVVNTGGRYDPLTDAWSSTSLAGAPQARQLHTAVWTGHEMVVWGGNNGSTLKTGGRYDPIADTWTPTSTVNAPGVRSSQFAVWTGQLMVVWGGSGGASGGRYDPVTDSWTPVSTVGAAGSGFATVWTGSVMIVWAGAGSSGRYDPVADTWTQVTSVGAPVTGSNGTAVWTGGAMIVWGGYANMDTNAGGRYDPVADAWSPTSTVGAPAPRRYHTAVWTGSLMVVWGGWGSTPGASGIFDSGGRYDPATDSWTPTSRDGAPSPRMNHSAVWTGTRIIVWGGDATYTSSFLNDGGRYDPATDAWTPMSGVGAPSARAYHTAVWTGSAMLVWGGYGSPSVDVGGRYDPMSDTWTPISTSGAPTQRERASAVWTGGVMVVWGGGGFLNTGGRYDPVSDRWSPTTTVGAPSGRIYQSAIWTGSRMIVWGGYLVSGGTFYYCNSGGIYDPVSDSWTSTSLVGAPSPRSEHAAVWTGSRMLVWGGYAESGSGSSSYFSSGGSYDPSTDTWSPTSTSGAPTGRADHSAVWTGAAMIVWGGSDPDGYLDTGGQYDPVADAWSATAITDAPGPRRYHTVVWTGNEMIVWGGDNGAGSFGDGGRYVPGGLGCDDGNACTLDTCDAVLGCVHTPVDGVACNDGDPCTAPDVCSSGTCVGAPAPMPPDIGSSVRLDGGTATAISWSDPPGPYNVYRGLMAGAWTYNHTCLDADILGPTTDSGVPDVGRMYYYLVSRRDDACHLESILGRDSSGMPDPSPSPCP